MTEARRKAKIALLQQGWTFSDLARSAGLSVATCHNVLDDKASSKKSKAALSNSLGVQIWPDVPLTERRWYFETGQIFIWPTIERARNFAEEIGSLGEIRGREVQIQADFYLPIRAPEPGDHSPSEEERAEMAARRARGEDDTIEIWSPSPGESFLPGSAFAPNDLEAAGDNSARTRKKAANEPLHPPATSARPGKSQR